MISVLTADEQWMLEAVKVLAHRGDGGTLQQLLPLIMRMASGPAEETPADARCTHEEPKATEVAKPAEEMPADARCASEEQKATESAKPAAELPADARCTSEETKATEVATPAEQMPADARCTSEETEATEVAKPAEEMPAGARCTSEKPKAEEMPADARCTSEEPKCDYFCMGALDPPTAEAGMPTELEALYDCDWSEEVRGQVYDDVSDEVWGTVCDGA